MSNKVTLNDLKNAYFELEEPKLINYCKSLVEEYFSGKINNIQIETDVTEMENETIYSFEILYYDSSVSIGFVFTKEEDSQEPGKGSLMDTKSIVPNIYITSNKLDISNYTPNNNSIIYIEETKTISFMLVSNTPNDEVKHMICEDIFEIAFNILKEE